MKHIRKFNEAFIIGSEPLENSMTLRKKMTNLMEMLVSYEQIVVDDIHPNGNAYSDDIININRDIASLSSVIDFENLEILLGDFIHKAGNVSESLQDSKEMDYDLILDLMKDHGWGDLSERRIRKFEKSKYYSGTNDEVEYAEEFHKFMYEISTSEME